jgi:LytS/YehU family sensor histidine kinase
MNSVRKTVFAMAGVSGGLIAVCLALLFRSSDIFLLLSTGVLCAMVGYLLHAIKVAGTAGNGQKEPPDDVPYPFLAQIRPLFLFNTLHNISALILFKPKKAIGIVENLANLLRAMMEMQKNDYTLLSQEIKCVDYYLNIEKDRFEDRLVIVKNIEPDSVEITMPRFFLLPFVESSITLGVEKHKSPVQIILSASCKEDRVIVEVSDTGEGFETEKEDELTLRKDTLSHLQARLRSLHGNKASVAFDALAPSGVRVRITIPVETDRTIPGQ